MAATWPDWLPQRFRPDGYSEADQDGVLASQTDTGPGKRRLRSSAVARPISGQMEFSTAQWLGLLTFRGETVRKVLPFWFPNPDEGGEEDLLLVRFVEPPSRSPAGPGQWYVTLSLEVLP